MKVSELEENVSLINLIAKDFEVTRIGKTLRVNPCPVCGSKDHFTIDENKNYYSSFSGCCNGGSVYKYLQEVKGMSEEAAFEELKVLAGDPTEYKKSVTASIPHKEIETETPIKNYTNTIIELYNKQSQEDKNYFINRGLTNEIIDKHKLCIGNVGQGRRIIVPIWENGQVVFYNSRSLTEQKPKYIKAKGEATFLNINYLETVTKGEIIVICEGEFDALSLEAIGIKSIAIGGTQYVDKMLKKIESTPTEGIIFLTAFDNDGPGIEATNKMNFNNLQIASEYNDLNEWLIANKSDFKTNISQQVQLVREDVKEAVLIANRPDSVSGYLKKTFITDIEKNKTYKDKKTGFNNLDKKMGGLYSGLYVVGGISSIGKTTFIQQMGDQLAEMGDHIIYFSLEQSKFELVSKSLSRLTAKKDYRNAVSGIDIRTGYIPQQVVNAAEDYEETSQRVNIIEGNFNTDVKAMKEYIGKYIKLNNVKPIIIIDYLQIIPGDMRLGDKQRVENTVTELKRITREFDITIFIISSLNRGNYLTPIDFESFKETGGIEYTADVVWGIQLQAIHDEIFNKDSKIKEKREIIKAAKSATPRKIELSCIKNRNGISSYSCGFIYYPQFDYFIEE